MSSESSYTRDPFSGYAGHLHTGSVRQGMRGFPGWPPEGRTDGRRGNIAFPGNRQVRPDRGDRSSSKVDHCKIRGGLLNLKFHPSALKGETGSANLLALIKTYFESPGFHVQFKVVDSRMLKDAQEHPENYRDLVVRVAGFSTYWVEMSEAR